jgi:hypothetical protein
MKKFIHIIILFIFIGIYYVSLNSNLMNIISDYRFNLEYFSPDTKYGDLYCFAYNSKIKVPLQKIKLETYNYINTNPANLYISCDSYVGVGKTVKINKPLNSSNFKNIDNVEFYRRSIERGLINLDTAKRNILIFEVVERNVRDMFADTSYFWGERNNLDFNHSEEKKHSSESAGFVEFLFNKKINQNLEFNLFSNPIFRVFKEWKAYLNTNIFNKANESVVSSNGNYLYYAPTIDSNLKTSSFNPISDNELHKIIININLVFSKYKNYGFDEVYISIIPNPVSILEPNRLVYNNLIQKIQNNRDLNVPFIDCLNIYKKINDQIFLNSDSHWNEKGMQLWINEVNNILTNDKINKK